eukprot:1517578-Amphidinium_carterae.1
MVRVYMGVRSSGCKREWLAKLFQVGHRGRFFENRDPVASVSSATQKPFLPQITKAMDKLTSFKEYRTIKKAGTQSVQDVII